jgi:hypothetical protein
MKIEMTDFDTKLSGVRLQVNLKMSRVSGNSGSIGK